MERGNPIPNYYRILSLWFLLDFILLSPLVLAQEGTPRPTEKNGVVLSGSVVDAATGEAIGRARIAVLLAKADTVSGPDGRFRLVLPFAEEVELQAGTVGYAMVRQRVQLLAGQETEVRIRLNPEASLSRSDQVTVIAAPFESVESGSVLERTLNFSELKNMASVLVDDPIRSVQGLPGVATGDDFNAQFSVRGAAFRNIGLYLDGVLTFFPFHSVHNIADGGSLTILNGDLVESVSLLSSAAPARFGDRTSSILSVYTRAGSADRRLNRVAAGITGVSYTGEGPLLKNRKLSGWISARKSYTDYIVNRIADDTNYVIGLWDVQGKLSWQLRRDHQFFLTALWGNSGLNRDRWIERLGMNSLLRGDNRSGIGNLQWNWTPRNNLILQTQTYLTSDQGENRNRRQEWLYRNSHRQWAAGSDLAWEWGEGRRFEIGFQNRRIRESGAERVYDSSAASYLKKSDYYGRGWQPSVYGQNSWAFRQRQWQMTLGLRLDHFGYTGETSLLPRAGLRLALHRRLSLSAGYGRYAQYPSWGFLLGEFRNPGLKAERSDHYVAGLELQLGARTRFLVEGYELHERQGIFTPDAEFRLLAGKVRGPQTGAAWQNSLRGRSRGIEFTLQRRSVNRLSGWLSYSYGKARMHDARDHLSFPMDFDQRHTLNLYGSYRLRQTVNLSWKYRYGSNFPIPGFLRTQGDSFYLAESRNLLRTPDYSRLDLRVNKAFFYRAWKLTLYFEVVNLLNRENIRYTGIDRIYGSTGRITLQKNTLFPILPTAGLLFEF